VPLSLLTIARARYRSRESCCLLTGTLGLFPCFQHPSTSFFISSSKPLLTITSQPISFFYHLVLTFSFFSLVPVTPKDLDITNDLARVAPHLPLDSNSYSEAYLYYGFPSNPISIYHTGDLLPTSWPRTTGPEAHRMPKEARPIYTHPIAPVWHELGQQIYEYFDSIDLKWTSIDPVCFAEVGEETGPLYLWVGVMPRTLSREHAENAALHCEQILAKCQITGVGIAFRDSVFTRSSSQLLNHIPSVDPTADVRSPFTPTLGIQIAPLAFPFFEGTGSLYLREGSKRDRVFLLTARHVVLPQSEYRNELYARKTNSWPRREVIFLGYDAFQNAERSISGKIEHEALMVDHYKNELEGLGEAVEGEDAMMADAREKFKGMLAEAEKSISSLDEFNSNNFSWFLPTKRILGHIIHAPPISTGTSDKHFTEDWALIELRSEKIDWNSFKGNVMHLSTFESISRRSSSLTIISRNQNYAHQFHVKDAPSC
jgi:hypothetical protein